jgi:hypothetical protein
MRQRNSAMSGARKTLTQSTWAELEYFAKKENHTKNNQKKNENIHYRSYSL